MPGQTNKRSLRIAVCDDDPLMLERLRILAEQTLSPQWELTPVCETSPRRILEECGSFQIAILDIHLAGCSGIDVAKTLVAENPRCRLIFVSGFLRYVSDVYDVPHMCLILKDQLDEQLPRFLLRAAEETAAQAVNTLTVRIKGGHQQLRICDICFLERKEHTTFIHLRAGRCLQTREKLDALLSRMPTWQMCRCHISFAVNLQWAESIQGRDFVMRGGGIVPISRVNMRAAKEAFFRCLRESV